MAPDELFFNIYPQEKSPLPSPSVRGSSHSEKQTVLFRPKPRIKKNFFVLETFFLFNFKPNYFQ